MSKNLCPNSECKAPYARHYLLGSNDLGKLVYHCMDCDKEWVNKVKITPEAKKFIIQEATGIIKWRKEIKEKIKKLKSKKRIAELKLILQKHLKRKYR